MEGGGPYGWTLTDFEATIASIGYSPSGSSGFSGWSGWSGADGAPRGFGILRMERMVWTKRNQRTIRMVELKRVERAVWT